MAVVLSPLADGFTAKTNRRGAPARDRLLAVRSCLRMHPSGPIDPHRQFVAQSFSVPGRHVDGVGDAIEFEFDGLVSMRQTVEIVDESDGHSFAISEVVSSGTPGDCR